MSEHTVEKLIGDYNTAVQNLIDYLDDVDNTKVDLYFSNGPSVMPYPQYPIKIKQYKTEEMHHVD